MRLRLTTAAIVLLALGVSWLVFPEPGARKRAQYLFVITLGYGHLLGAALAPRVAPASWLVRAAVATGFASGLALYAAFVSVQPGVVVALLALSLWHIAENDSALAQALARNARVGAPVRGRGAAAPLVSAALLGGVALASFPRPGLLGDLFTVATLYHLVGWLLFLRARGASFARLLALHAPPAVLALALLVLPLREAALLREWLFSPALYLYGSALHVVHTVLRRLRAPEACAVA